MRLFFTFLLLASSSAYAAEDRPFSWITDLWEQFKNFMLRIVYTISDMLYDLVIKVFDILMYAVQEMISGIITILAPIDLQQYVNFPSDVVGVLILIGIPQCLAAIATALSIRFLLQLIPLVRLGS